MRRIPVVAVIFNKRLLMIHRNHNSKYPNQWCLPGGKIEEGETPEQCAIRELLEETGININVGSVATQESPMSLLSEVERLGTIFMVYAVRLPELPTITLEDEFFGYGWFTYDDTRLMSDVMSPAWDAARLVQAV